MTEKIGGKCKGRGSPIDDGLLRITSLAAIAFMLFAFVLPFSNASSCGTLPTSISTLIIACYPVNVVNTQAGATAANFQQAFNALPFNAIAGNVVFYNGTSGQLLPAWAESNSLIWVNLKANTIAGTSSANGIYYFGFGSSSTNFFISGNQIGEAPQLSAVYNQYDNGNAVFSNYWNFTGIALPAGWSAVGTNYAVSNGLTLSKTSVNTDLWSGQSINPQTTIADELGYINGASIDWGVFYNYGLNSNTNHNYYVQTDSTHYVLKNFGGTGSSAASTVAFGTTNHVFSIYTTTAASFLSIDYANPISLSGSFSASTSVPLGAGSDTTSAPIFIQWMRTRAMPPSNVMPTITLGAMQSIATSYIPPIYLQNSTTNPAITFPSLAGIPTCSDTLGGQCTGTDSISGTLTNNLYVLGSIVLTGALNSNGFIIVAQFGTFNGLGQTITTGNSQSAIGTGGISIASGSPGGNSINSFAGSAGGGGGSPNAGGANGGNTLALAGRGGASGNPGTSGANTPIPTLTSSNVISYCQNIQAYLSGTSGGGGGGSNGNGGNGGPGANGLCIIANTIKVGTINANGIIGVAGSTGGASAGGGGGGGGGGGVILLIYGTGGLTSGTTNVLGGSAGAGGSGGSGAGSAGGSGGNGNVLSYQYATPLIDFPRVTFPFELYSSNSSITYTLNSVVGATQTTIAGPTNTLAWQTTNSNQPSGNYNFAVVEYNGVGSTTQLLNFSINMNDIASPLAFTGSCAGPIQYFPNCALAPSFNANPTLWNFISDNSHNLYNNGNYISGTNNIDIWSNANTSFIPQILLTYGQFSPAISFIANVTDNPSITSITQNAFTVTASNVVPAYPTTRKIFSIATQNEQTLAKLNTSTTLSFVALFNNYTINNQTKTTGYNSFNIYISNSIFQTPPVYIQTLISSSTNASYFPAQNNFCPGFINQTNPTRSLFIYLVSYAVGQATTVNIQSNAGGANNGDYLQILSGVNPLYATVVQQVLISTQSFLNPLIIGNSYSAIILGPNCQKIYSTPAAPQTNPWYINVPSNINITQIVLPAVTASCSLSYNTLYSANMVTCTGIDYKNLVNSWNVSIYNSAGFGGLHQIASNVINATSFTWKYYPIPYGSPANWKIVWYYGGSNDPSGSNSGLLQNIFNTGYSLPLDTFITILFLLVGIAVGANTGNNTGGNTHKLSNTLFIEAFFLFILYMVGVTSWIGTPFTAAAILFLVVIGILGYRQEGTTITG